MDMTKATPQDISDYKMRWKPGFVVDVHSDLHVQCKDWCRKHLERWEWSMDTYTDVYNHTFHFEQEEDADAFRKEFIKWVDVGKS